MHEFKLEKGQQVKVIGIAFNAVYIQTDERGLMELIYKDKRGKMIKTFVHPSHVDPIITNIKNSKGDK